MAKRLFQDEKESEKPDESSTDGSVVRETTLLALFSNAINEASSDHEKFDADYFIRKYRNLISGDTFGTDEHLLEFYFRNVQAKQLDPNGYFSESGYLQENDDIVGAIRSGHFFCGFHHWLVSGNFETREGWRKAVPYVGPVQRFQSGEIRKKSIAKSSKPLSDFDTTRGIDRLTQKEICSILTESGLVDIRQYVAWYPDLAVAGIDPIGHYVDWGHKESRVIHPFFDQDFYLQQNPDIDASNTLPLLHYLLIGASEGRNPHILLDTKMYATKYSLDLSKTNPLIHYSLSKNRETLLETPYFDREYYIEQHPESLQFPGGPFLHFIYFGVYSGLKPSKFFNPRYYYVQYLKNDYKINAYFHFLAAGAEQGFEPQIPTEKATVAREVAKFANPSQNLEELDINLSKGMQRRARLIAFYLPQFHPFPENDEWWGKGFTEWRNLARGLPRFAGHYQPRIPRDLGFYDLRDETVLQRQVELALGMGISAFCFYFYWFNRHRLMEKPLDAFVANKSLDMPFMIMWANENWTRRWDGAENELLITQDHKPEDDVALVDCLQGYFADKRYIRINGRPLLVIYRADIIPQSAKTLETWRAIFRERHNEEPIFFLAQTFKAEDPWLFGFDGAIEFPPHKIGSHLPEINRELDILDWDYEGSVRRYSDAIDASLGEQVPNFPLIKTVFPSWDNNARRQDGGMVFHGATPDLFARWLDGAINYSIANPVMGENIVFLNAWNEWCEGAYLEPDIHYGGAMLNRVAQVVSQQSEATQSSKLKVLLIGHDAFPAGAQRNLLAIATTLQNRFGVEIHVLLLGSGDLLKDYQSAIPTSLCSSESIDQKLDSLAASGFNNVIANTTIAGGLSAKLKRYGYKVVSLVHELPNLIKQYKLEDHANSIRQFSDYVVFPSLIVQNAFRENFGTVQHTSVVRPQGIYQRFERDSNVGSRIRDELGIPADEAIILNVGHGDVRKGIDLFCQTAHLSFNRKLRLHFVWVGSLHPELEGWFKSDAQRNGITNLHFVGERSDVADFMNAANVFYLTSREDPFPSVLLEAMQVGLPILAYSDAGGFTDLIASDSRLGALVQQNDLDAVLKKLEHFSNRDSTSLEDIDYRIDKAKRDFSFADYVFDLLRLLYPQLKKVSVVIPNYNYEQYIRARLNSVFDQTYPLYEVLVMDDCSQDKSVEEIFKTIAVAGRQVAVLESHTNSGNVFAQWRKGTEIAEGELIWIAEADDLAKPNFLETLVAEHVKNDGCSFAFTDSKAIDSRGYAVYESYIPYANGVIPGLLDKNRVFEGLEFARDGLSVANLILNVSSVVWKADALRYALSLSGETLREVNLVGDWLLYFTACIQGGSVAYIASPLNIHRRHSNSVTSHLNIEAHLAEITKMHSLSTKAGGNRKTIKKAQMKYLDDTREWLMKTNSA